MVTSNPRAWISGVVAQLAATRARPQTPPVRCRVKDVDLASCYTAAFDPRVGGDQGDVEGLGQGDILGVVCGQAGMKAL